MMHITDVDHALAILRELCDRRAAGATHVEDEPLASWVAAHPGLLETRLTAAAERMAMEEDRDSDILRDLFLLLTYRTPSTLKAMDPAAMLRCCQAASVSCAAQAAWSSAVYPLDMALDLASGLDRRDLDGVGLRPEFRDAILAQMTGTPLPDILPDHVADMTPAEVGEILATYTGVPLGALVARMQPRAWSGSGFLAPGESLPEIIIADAQTLANLGVSRHAIADRIELICEVLVYHQHLQQTITSHGARIACSDADTREQRRLMERLGAAAVEARGRRIGSPWNCRMIHSLGSQQDPFHSVPVHHPHPVGGTYAGSSDFTILNLHRGRGAAIRGSNLAPALIRRAGFFEGSVPYRLDPATAAWVLGLTDRAPARPISGDRRLIGA